MDFTDLKDYVSISKEALDLLKTAYSVLPKGEQRDKVEQAVGKAAELLARNDAKLAKDLGYKLCQCTFPPQMMLWREAENSWVCQNASCGAKFQRAYRPEAAEEVARRPGWADVRAGRGRRYGRE